MLHKDSAKREGTRPSEGFITVTQAMKRLGVCRATVYAMCRRGVLSHRRLLNMIYIEARDLQCSPGEGP